MPEHLINLMPAPKQKSSFISGKPEFTLVNLRLVLFYQTFIYCVARLLPARRNGSGFGHHLSPEYYKHN